MILTISTETPRLVIAAIRRQISNQEAKCRQFNRDMVLRAELEELREIERQLVAVMPEQSKKRIVDDDTLWSQIS